MEEEEEEEEEEGFLMFLLALPTLPPTKMIQGEANAQHFLKRKQGAVSPVERERDFLPSTMITYLPTH